MNRVFWTLGCIFFGIGIGTILPNLIRRLRKPAILRVIPKEEAKELICDYIENNKGKMTSDVIFDLGLDVALVLIGLKELEQEGKIEAQS